VPAYLGVGRLQRHGRCDTFNRTRARQLPELADAQSTTSATATEGSYRLNRRPPD